MKTILLIISCFIILIGLTACAEAKPNKEDTIPVESTVKEEAENDTPSDDQLEEPFVSQNALVITDAKYIGNEYSFHEFSFTVKNKSDKVINTISLNINLLDKDGNIVSTTYPQEPSRLQPEQSITLDTLCEDDRGICSAIVDGYSFCYEDELFTGYIDNSPLLVFDVDGDDAESVVSIAHDAFIAATTMTIDDLTGGPGNWKYKGIPLLSDDCEWIDSPINTKGTVSQGVMYKKFAMMLWGSDFEGKRFLYSYKNISEILLGFIPESVDEYIPYGKNASEFIVTKDQLSAIMHKFETLESVTGEYDYDYKKFGKYTVDIPDLTKCAEEMQISEEMLGYILAMLTEYAAELDFDGNSCYISYTSFV